MKGVSRFNCSSRRLLIDLIDSDFIAQGKTHGSWNVVSD